MKHLGILVIMAITIAQCLGASSDLETFFKSGIGNKEEEDDSGSTEQEQTKATEEDIAKLMRRSGFMMHPQQQSISSKNSNSNILSALQTLSQQQQQPKQYYYPQYTPTAQAATNYVQHTADTGATQQQVPAQNTAYGQIQSPPATTKNNNIVYTGQNQGTVGKADRQGYYGDDGHAYDGHSGYSGEVASHGHHHHHHPEPQKIVHLPVPSLGIKLDPFGLLKLLLQAIPRPLLNLNGKVFFGVELGKGVALGKGVGHSPHGGHGGKVITFGK